MSRIPDAARVTVRFRARHRCERCGSSTVIGEWHHRRSRRVVDSHTHCPCNGVWLCHTCHLAVHNSPTRARADGWIVSQWVEEPGTVPVITPWGTRTHDCAGRIALTL